MRRESSNRRPSQRGEQSACCYPAHRLAPLSNPNGGRPEQPDSRQPRTLPPLPQTTPEGGEARTAPRARAVRSAGVYRAPFRSKLKVNLSAVKSLRSASLQNVIEVKALSFAYCVEKPAKSHSTRTFQILESDSRPHPYGARIFRKICKICKHLSVLLVPLNPRNPLAS